VQSHNAKLKAVFIFTLSALFLFGCAQNVDLREQARESKAKEQSLSAFENSVDLKEEKNNQLLENNATEKKPIRILFVGDMMFDRHIREAVEKYGGPARIPMSASGSEAGKDYNYILEPVKESLSQYDLVVGNLEGPITGNKSVSVATKMDERNNFIFTFDPSVAQVLAENNIKLVDLGNNHILNQGEKGVEQTKKYLDEAGVGYFGDTGNDESSTLVKDFREIKIGFVSYNYSVPNSIEIAVENIKSAREQSDVVIVCSHWGTEYKTGDPGATIRALAHRFIDAGADAIIGTHPHVVQTSEEFQGKKIYYSLGNFIFDQYFQKETMEGLGAEVMIKSDGTIEYNELKFEMTKKGQTMKLAN